MNFYDLSLMLEMSMMTGHDLPDDAILIMTRFAGNRGIYICYADKETGAEKEEQIGSWPIEPHGSLDMHNPGDGIWRLGNVHATDGWGPMLYEVAIEYSTANGKGMIGDPREMSDDAIGVFTKYMNRPDVKKTPLPPKMIPPSWAAHPELHFIYSIPGTPMTKHLLDWDQLIIK